MSLAVVVIGVVFSLGTMDLFGYKITLLNALTPTLVVVIGIPNCIYFMNKYHTAYRDTGDKHEALILMIGRMGIVTFFCNLTAAIGFGVFALTRSAILNEFGVVAGINIMLLVLYLHYPDPDGAELSSGARAKADALSGEPLADGDPEEAGGMDGASSPACLCPDCAGIWRYRWPGCSGCSRRGLSWTIFQRTIRCIPI
jgi:hypothetical protein